MAFTALLELSNFTLLGVQISGMMLNFQNRLNEAISCPKLSTATPYDPLVSMVWAVGGGARGFDGSPHCMKVGKTVLSKNAIKRKKYIDHPTDGLTDGQTAF